MNTTEIFLVAMLVIFTAPYLVWRVGRTDYFAPLVVVQILTGIALGPGLMGAWFPEAYAFVFTPAVIQSLHGIAWWAVMVFVWIAAAWLLAAAVAGKLLGAHIAARLLGWQRGEASLVGWLLQTKALIMIIFANVLLDKQIITSETFTAMLLMAVASTMLTVPVVTPMLRRLGPLAERAH